MERAKCKSFLSGMMAVQSAVEKKGKEMKTKPRSIVSIVVVGRASRILGKGGRPRERQSQSEAYSLDQ